MTRALPEPLRGENHPIPDLGVARDQWRGALDPVASYQNGVPPGLAGLGPCQIPPRQLYSEERYFIGQHSDFAAPGLFVQCRKVTQDISLTTSRFLSIIPVTSNNVVERGMVWQEVKTSAGIVESRAKQEWVLVLNAEMPMMSRLLPALSSKIRPR